MNEFDVAAEKRTDVGKGASRRLRRTGKIPGIVYGGDDSAMMITLPHNEMVHHLEHEAFYSHILNLTIDGKKQKVVLKDLQRHVYKPEVLHVDFQRVSDKEKLTMNVPIHFKNEEKCAGVKAGGVISHVMSELEIQCLPKDLPEFIEIDMLEVELGSSIHLGEIALPEGVEIYALTHGGDASQSVVSVHQPKVTEEVEETEEAAPEDAGDAESGDQGSSD